MLRSVINLRRVVLSGFGLVAPALALEGQQPSLRYDVRFWPAGVVLVAATVGTLIPELAGGSLPHATCAPCDPSGLPGIDRAILGPLRSLPAALSDGGLVVSQLGGALLLAHTRRGEPGAWREDAAVLAQSVMVTAAIMEWTKVLVSRPRPVRYGPEATLFPQPTNGLSFPSGHAAIAFASAAAYASILHRRGVAGRHKTEIAALFTAAGFTGTMRVVARKHFPTDVLGGAVLGTVVGWVLPRVHAVR
jgi:undecaprenyl-diphosphatase